MKTISPFTVHQRYMVRIIFHNILITIFDTYKKFKPKGKSFRTLYKIPC